MKLRLGLIGLIAAAGIVFSYSAHAEQGGGQQEGMQQEGIQQQDQMTQQGEAAPMDRKTIEQVQQALKDKGYDAGPVDGNWGSKTQSAVKNFQQSQGMQATGQLDQQTLAALGISGGAAAGGQQQDSMGAGQQNSGQ